MCVKLQKATVGVIMSCSMSAHLHGTTLLPLLGVSWELILEDSGLGSSVGIVTELQTGWSGIESRRRQDFPPVQTSPGAHPASCKMGAGSFLGVKCDRGMLLFTHPLLVPQSWKSRDIPLHTLWALPPPPLSLSLFKYIRGDLKLCQEN